MKKIAQSSTFNMVTAAALCLSFVVCPGLRTLSAKVPYAGADLKTEATVRTEASRYDAAIKAIGAISSFKLENADELKKALAIFELQKPNLKLNPSKLIVLGLSDSAFSSAVRKRSADKAAAEALIKEVSADPKAVLKIDGAESLAARLKRSNESDAAILQRVAQSLKAAAAKFKQARNAGERTDLSGSDEWRLLNASYREDMTPNEWVTPPQDVLGVLVIVAAVVVLVEVAYFGYLFVKNLVTEGPDPIAHCIEDLEGSYKSCVSAARNQPFPLNFAAEALCDADYLEAYAGCLIHPQ